jgi:hypothetical protein
MAESCKCGFLLITESAAKACRFCMTDYERKCAGLIEYNRFVRSKALELLRGGIDSRCRLRLLDIELSFRADSQRRAARKRESQSPEIFSAFPFENLSFRYP